MMMISPRMRWLVLAATVFAIACSKKTEDGKIPLTEGAKMPADSVHKGLVAPLPALAELSAESKAALDSGNALFRKKAYVPALERYRVSSSLAPGHPSPLYGIYMVARATKDSVLADSALAEIRAKNAVQPHDAPDTSALNALRNKAAEKPLKKA